MTNFFQFLSSGMLIGGLYSLVGVSIVLVFKATNVASMAHGQLMAFGAIFFWIFLVGIGFPVWLSLLLMLILSGVLGFVTERLTIRPLIGQSIFAIFLMTYAVFMFLEGIFQLYLAGRARSYHSFLPQGNFDLMGVVMHKGVLSGFLISLLVFVGLFLFFKFTKTGLRMRATSENHVLAQSAGVGVKNIFSVIWVLSSIVVGIAGILFADIMDIHQPLPYLGIKGLIVAIFGGLESIGGVLLAGILLGVLENIAAGYLDVPLGGGVKEVVSYLVLLLVLLVKPYGLFGLKRIERI